MNKEENMRIHLKCLSKSSCAKDCGESTVILLGYAVSIVEEEIDKVRKETIKLERKRIKKIIEKLLEKEIIEEKKISNINKLPFYIKESPKD